MEPNSRRERTVLGWALGVSLAALLLDQWTKIVVERQFVLGESRPVWEPFFSLTFVRNEGAAWSILSAHGWFLLLVARSGDARRHLVFPPAGRRGTPSVISRCCSYSAGWSAIRFDRIWRGAVVDFFDFHWYDKFRWPVFNVADIAICIGVGLFVLSTLLRPSGKKEEPESGAEFRSARYFTPVPNQTRTGVFL